MYASKAIRYTLTWAQRKWFFYCTLGFEMLVIADWTLGGGRYGGGPGTASVGFVLFGLSAAMRRVGISLTEQHAVVHALPGMRIPWHDVSEVEVEHLLGVKTVVLHHKGRRTRLTAPTTAPWGEDREFQAKVKVIRSFWTTHRDLEAAA